MSLEALKAREDLLRERWGVWRGRLESLKQNAETERVSFNVCRQDVSDIKAASSVLHHVSAEVNKANEEQAATLATLALRETFPDQHLTLLVEHSTQRGNPGVSFKLKDELTGVEGDPMESFGGGPASLIGLVLQVISTVRQSGMVRTLILDEPLSQVSSGYERLAGQLLRKLCDPPPRGLGFKMLVVTHSTAISEAAHRKYVVEKEGNYLKIRLGTND